MSAFFSKKRIENTATLGELLKMVRYDRGWSLKEASKQAKLEEEHVHALEEHRYDLLPSDVYIKNYLRRYCKALQVDYDEAVLLFEEEYRIYNKLHQQKEKKKQEKINDIGQRITFTPRSIRVIALSLVVIVLLTYFVILLRNILQPPDLQITFPPNNLVTDEELIKIRGITETEVSLTINGQLVNIDELGNFEERVTLNEGLNVIEVIAKKEHSRPNTALLNVIVKEK